MPNLVPSSLDNDDKAFLLQFVNNCESAGVLWQVGKLSTDASTEKRGPEYVVKALVGTTICLGRNERLHRAIKECVSAALPSGKLTL